MRWFVFAAVCMLGWGTADLFYKKGTREDDPDSHLKIAVWVGLVMGVSALCLLPFSETGLSFGALAGGMLRYAPASAGYILSMIIGYAGLRYLELSIVSPVQNASGALSAICMAVYFAACGRSLTEEFTGWEIAGTLLIVAGVVALAFAEHRQNVKESGSGDKKYRSGALALLFPLLYCVFDTVGTAADGILLDEESGWNLGEIDVIILYGLTFFAVGAVIYVYLWIKNGKPYNLFARSEAAKGVAALCEEFGQVFYVFAMASRPVLAAPMVASYCMVSVLLSRVFLGEKLRASQYVCIAAVMAGILLLGIAEGLAEV